MKGQLVHRKLLSARPHPSAGAVGGLQTFLCELNTAHPRVPYEVSTVLQLVCVSPSSLCSVGRTR